ncbi:PhoH family protein [Methylobacter tundripaludum]|uniref:PhoH family protein n=1 Tax=Methylobacter tundripaludum TaxID=173365 RepID=UPI0004DF5BB5|nr:PhoH family protein [Methylobacter tundripaludum]
MIKEEKQEKRCYVLDTNVLIHNPESLFKFDEHFIFITKRVLLELDHHKTGNRETARNAREVHRHLDNIIENASFEEIKKGINLPNSKGRLLFQTFDIDETTNPDDEIINAIKHLEKHKNLVSEETFTIVLVTKDINMRIRSSISGIQTEDYRHEKISLITDEEILGSGRVVLTNNYWIGEGINCETFPSSEEPQRLRYKITAPWASSLLINSNIYKPKEDSGQHFNAIVKEIHNDYCIAETLDDYKTRKSVWGLNARSDEQSFALNLLNDPEIDFVSISGEAGSGKTLLSLASALSQVFDQKYYDEIIVTRATIPLGKDIGFLPGEEINKVEPWMGSVLDSIDYLSGNTEREGFEKTASRELLLNKIKLKSTTFMRGRSFAKKYFIIDEAQNLSPHEILSLVSRSGEGTKVVVIGNLKQIDTPYLTPSTSGLAYVIDKMKNWEHSAHITLKHVERSRLATYISEHF